MALQTSGAISLNDIHVEAGGSSGTTASINDADIRGLINKSSGATSSFSEFYGASASIYSSPDVLLGKSLGEADVTATFADTGGGSALLFGETGGDSSENTLFSPESYSHYFRPSNTAANKASFAATSFGGSTTDSWYTTYPRSGSLFWKARVVMNLGGSGNDSASLCLDYLPSNKNGGWTSNAEYPAAGTPTYAPFTQAVFTLTGNTSGAVRYYTLNASVTTANTYQSTYEWFYSLANGSWINKNNGVTGNSTAFSIGETLNLQFDVVS